MTTLPTSFEKEPWRADVNSSEAGLALPSPLRLFLLVSLSLSALCVIVELVCAFLLHLHYPYNWPLTPPDEIALDLKMFHQKFTRFHHADFFATEPGNGFAYPAPMAVLYKLTYLIPNHRTAYFMLVLVFLVFASAFLVARAATRRGLKRGSALLFCSLTVILSYPFITDAKQGNLELAVWVLVSLGVWLFLRDQDYGSAACFAVAGSMKIFPLIYLGLHLSRGRKKAFTFGLATTIAVTLISLWLLVPDIPFAWFNLQHGIAGLRNEFMLNVNDKFIGFDHSLFSVIKKLSLAAGTQLPIANIFRFYMATVAIAGVVIFFTRIRHLPVANQVLALTICAILLPPLSFDYTLIHLYPPLAILMFVTIASTKPPARLPGLQAAFVLMAASLAPLSELIYHGVRFGGQVRALLLVTLLVVTLSYPFPIRANASDSSV